MYKAFVNDSSEAISLIATNEGIGVNGQDLLVDIYDNQNKSLQLLINNKCYFAELIEIDRSKKKIELLLNGKKTTVFLKDRFDELLHEMGIDKIGSDVVINIKAPMPGLVLSIKASVADIVNKGDILLVLEAMKMENSIKSPGSGVVKSILVEKGMAVDKNQVLIEFES